MAATTFRSDAVAAVRTVLLAQQTATPTLLRAVYSARPGSFPETPCAYIANRDEDIAYTAQTRTRTATGLTVVIVDTLIDASEEGDRMDDLIDLLVDRFTLAKAGIPGGGGRLQLANVRDTDIVLSGDTGAVTYRGAILGFGGPSPTFIMEGTA